MISRLEAEKKVRAEWDAMMMEDREAVLFEIGGDLAAVAWLSATYRELPKKIAKKMVDNFMAVRG